MCQSVGSISFVCRGRASFATVLSSLRYQQKSCLATTWIGVKIHKGVNIICLPVCIIEIRKLQFKTMNKAL